MRKMENELRNRDSEEVLLSALQSMQEKNLSLEKSLSCETRFKLDLFSALGEARRQIELKDGECHSVLTDLPFQQILKLLA